MRFMLPRCGLRMVSMVGFVVFSTAPVLGEDAPTPVALPPAAAPTPVPTPNAAQKAALNAADDEIQKADAVIEAARATVTTASSQASDVADANFSSTDSLVLKKLDDLSATLSNISGAKQMTVLTNALDRLDKTGGEGAKQKLETARGTLKTEMDKADVPKNIKEQLQSQHAAVEKKLEEIKKQHQSVTTAKATLTTALDGVYTKISALLEAVATSLDNGLGENADAPKLLKNLPSEMQRIEQAQRVRVGIRQRWDGQDGRPSLKVKLVAAGTSKTEDGKVESSFLKADGKVVERIKWLADWFQRLTTEAKAQSAVLLEKNTRLMGTSEADIQSRLARGNEALLLSVSGETTATQLQSIVTAWPSLLVQIEDVQDANVMEAITNFKGLESTTLNFRAALSALQEWLAGDMTKFKADQVTLYYFGDVKRLMMSLNKDTQEIGGTGDLQVRADQARRRLTEAELAAAEAQGTVNTLQGQVIELTEKQRRLRATLNVSEDLAKRSLRYLSRLTEKQSVASTAFDAVKSQNGSSDAAKQLAFDQAKAKLNQLNGLVSTETERNTDAQEAYSRDKEEYDAAKDEQLGLPAKTADAQAQLQLAQANVRRLRANAFLAVQEEMQAFAKARDNAPFLYSPSYGLSTDVARRVRMYAYTDSKTIFLRGNEQDLKDVQDIIAIFDRPAPQARLALWTMELNGDGSKSGYDKFNKALLAIEQNLSDTRAQLAAAQSILRDSINFVVNEAVSTGETASDNPFKDFDDQQLKRYYFYTPEVWRRLGFSTEPTTESVPKQHQIASFVKQNLPDPAGTTTLGEALMVLSLARRPMMNRVLEEFEKRLSDQSAFGPAPYDVEHLKSRKGRRANVVYPESKLWFASLRAALGALPNQNEDVLTASQLEITRALQRVAVNRIVKDFINGANHLDEANRALTANQAQLTSSIEAVQLRIAKSSALIKGIDHDIAERIDKRLQNTQLKEENRKQLQDQRDKHEQRKAAANVRMTNDKDRQQILEDALQAHAPQRRALAQAAQALKERVLPAIEWIRSEFPSIPISEGLIKNISNGDRDDKLNQSTASGDAAGERELTRLTQQLIDSLQNLARALEPLYSPVTTNRRVAAADQMLKEVVTAMEDDLDRYFVKPMLDDLRQEIKAQGIGVGIIQHTTMLATNRLIARVDPSATAQLAVGQETDVLEATKQLAQLYLASQTLGTTAVLGELGKQPQAKKPELYGITSGAKFEVTPIIDPSGQALRFKFDYSLQNQVREPDGTVNPQLPRVTRHTVNTEVQLSNLEIRNVSQFDTNFKLGLPTKYSGGIPILNDIPVLNRIPLLGWFKRQGGQNAQIQQSVILAQTTIYPTIGDITGLLAAPGAG